MSHLAWLRVTWGKSNSAGVTGSRSALRETVCRSPLRRKPVSLQVGRGPALSLYSAQLFSFRWPASNDSEAFDNAVATAMQSLNYQWSNDSQFKFQNDATGSEYFRFYRTQQLQLSGARAILVFLPPWPATRCLLAS